MHGPAAGLTPTAPSGWPPWAVSCRGRRRDSRSRESKLAAPPHPHTPSPGQACVPTPPKRVYSVQEPRALATHSVFKMGWRKAESVGRETAHQPLPALPTSLNSVAHRVSHTRDVRSGCGWSFRCLTVSSSVNPQLGWVLLDPALFFSPEGSRTENCPHAFGILEIQNGRGGACGMNTRKKGACWGSSVFRMQAIFSPSTYTKSLSRDAHFLNKLQGE